MGEFVATHLPCAKCGSSDAASLNDDGFWTCFSCDARWKDDSGDLPARPGPRPPDLELPTGDIKALTKRGITQATCRHWNYQVRITPQGHAEHLAVYCDDHRRPVAVKVRDTGKDGSSKGFRIEGDAKAMGLYGKWLWPSKGKMVIVTEGEIDALSASQSQGNKWPVVSVPNGAQSAAKSVTKDLQWLSGFDKIIFMFDMDEPGQRAAEECARIIPPGKAYIAQLSEKDPNACLTAGKEEEISRAAWNAKQFRPDGIVSALDLIGQCLTPPNWGLAWPWKFLTKWTYGRRYGELYVFGAGTGVGKTDALAQIVAHTISVDKEATAVFNYEAAPQITLKAIVGKLGRRRYHIPDPDLWTEDELRHDLHRLETECAPLFINDHFGSCDWDRVKERVRYVVHAENVKHVVIDPLSSLVLDADDERKELDKVVFEMASLAQELNICIYLVSHLTRPSLGPSHEEGGQVRGSQFRGSNAIQMFAFFIFGFERNTQAEDASERTKTLVRCVKDRYTGNSTGKTYPLHYDSLGGTLDEGHLAMDGLDA